MDWLSNIISLLVGLGAGWSLRIVYSSRKTKINNTSNANNIPVIIETA